MRKLVVLSVMWALPLAAYACPVCQDPNDPRGGAYFNMTMFMSFTPLLAIAGIVFWLYRRAMALES